MPRLYDPPFLKRYGCAALFCEEARLVLAIPEGHPLYGRGELTPDELKGSVLRMPGPGLCELFDRTAAFLRENYPQLQVTDMSFRSLEAYNDAFSRQEPIFTLRQWSLDHPLFKTAAVSLPYTGSFGLIHALKPSGAVESFLKAVSGLRKKP